ncbi:MAG: nucleotidyltransferase domain-containing protein [Candidatus Poribacteria bacterium]
MDTAAFTQLKKFIDKVARAYKIHEVIFFGSRARGDYLLHSDVDLIIVSDDFEGIFFPDRSTAMYKFWDGGLPLEVLCYTVKEFEKKKRMIGLIQDAVREGISIA